MRHLRFLARVLAVGLVFAWSTVAGAQRKSVHVRGYTTRNGKVVAPHMRGAPGTGTHSHSSHSRSLAVPNSSVAPAPRTLTPRSARTGTKTTPVPTTEPTQAGVGVPNGATAQCRDNSFSKSATHSGTCSHHGGVAKWLPKQ